MITISPEFDEEVPPWDVALEALLREEFMKGRKPLRVEDVERLATQYLIRFDDLMTTLFELTVQGYWQYQRAPGVVEEITRSRMDEVWANGRLELEFALTAYPGGWRIPERAMN